jgi:hypothetical protein
MVNGFKSFKGAMAKFSLNQKGIERVDAATRQRYLEEARADTERNSEAVVKFTYAIKFALLTLSKLRRART